MIPEKIWNSWKWSMVSWRKSQQWLLKSSGHMVCLNEGFAFCSPLVFYDSQERGKNMKKEEQIFNFLSNCCSAGWLVHNIFRSAKNPGPLLWSAMPTCLSGLVAFRMLLAVLSFFEKWGIFHTRNSYLDLHSGKTNCFHSWAIYPLGYGHRTLH